MSMTRIKIAKSFLAVLVAVIAIITIQILGKVEAGNFMEVFHVLPAYIGICIGTHFVRRHMNSLEIETLISIAYARAQAQNVVYADEADILNEFLTKKEHARLKALRGEYPYEDF